MPYDSLDVLGVAIDDAGTLILIILFDLPDPDGLVPAAGGQVLAGTGPRHALHLVLVPFEGGHALELSAAPVPDASCGVEARRCQEVAAR